jgi:hypothetical protein
MYVFRYSCSTSIKHHSTKECVDSKHCLVAKVFVQSRKINAPACILFAICTTGSLLFVPISCYGVVAHAYNTVAQRPRVMYDSADVYINNWSMQSHFLLSCPHVTALQKSPTTLNEDNT